MLHQLSQRLNFRRFFVGEGPQPPPYQLRHRNVYILPTKQGLIFAVLLMLMLIGAINYNNNLAYLMTFLLASLSVVAILHTYRNLLRLLVTIGHIEPRFVERGQNYYRQGKVLAVSILRDGQRIEGEVAGTRRQPYQVRIDVHSDDD